MKKEQTGNLAEIPYKDLVTRDDEDKELVHFYYEHVYPNCDDLFYFMRSKGRKLTKDELEELYSETLIRAIKHRGQLRHIEKIKNWMFVIGKNVINSHYRELKRKQKLFLSLPLDDSDESAPVYGLMENIDFTVDKVMENCQMERLKGYLDRLTEDQRYAIIMHHTYGAKFEEIARLRNVKKTTAYGWYRRGTARLRHMIEADRRDWDD